MYPLQNSLSSAGSISGSYRVSRVMLATDLIPQRNTRRCFLPMQRSTRRPVSIRVDPFLLLLARLARMNPLIGLAGMRCDEFGLGRLCFTE